MPGLRIPLPPPMGWRAPSIRGVSVRSPRRLYAGAAVAPGQAAAIRVELLTDAFTRSLTRYVEVTHEGMRDTLASMAMEFHARIVGRTPVDTGRAQNSWHVLLPGTRSDSFRYSDNRGNSFDGGLGQVDLGLLEAGVGSNVTYMVYLEGGWSRQSPAGMVAISLLEVRGGLDRRVGEVLTAGWEGA